MDPVSWLSSESRNRILESLYERVKHAVEMDENLQWDSLVSGFRGFQNIATKRRYTGRVNNLLLALSSLEMNGDPRFLTHAQLRAFSHSRGYVCKGSRLTPVFCPILRTTTESDETEEETQREVFLGYRLAYVANVRQTNLLSLGLVEEKWQEVVGRDPQPVAAIDAFAARIPFRREPSFTHPFYSDTRDTIGIPNEERFRETFGYAEALAHEIIHWTGHESRLRRDMARDKESASLEELVACVGSTFILDHLGIALDSSRIERQSAYLKFWLKHLKDSPSELLVAAHLANEATDYLVDLAEGKLIANDLPCLPAAKSVLFG